MGVLAYNLCVVLGCILKTLSQPLLKQLSLRSGRAFRVYLTALDRRHQREAEQLVVQELVLLSFRHGE